MFWIKLILNEGNIDYLYIFLIDDIYLQRKLSHNKLSEDHPFSNMTRSIKEKTDFDHSRLLKILYFATNFHRACEIKSEIEPWGKEII